MQMKQVMMYIGEGVSGGKSNEGSETWTALAGGAIVVKG